MGGPLSDPSAGDAENNSPDDAGYFVERIEPGQMPVLHVRERGRENTRRGIAYSLIAILAVAVLTACAGWLWTDADLEKFGLVLSGLTGLTGTAVGFYFSSER